MIISIAQTRSNGASEFTILIDGTYSHWGKCPRLFKSFDCILCNVHRELMYQTKYQRIENLKNNIPYKWIFSKMHSEICSTINSNNEVIGSFEFIKAGWLDSYYNINFKDFSLKGYSISKGTCENILLFLEDKQIGQIVKNLCVRDNLDKYYIYLLDKYSELSTILSMFTLYYDNWNYGHQGEFVKAKYEYSKQYTFNKYNKLYNPDWISSNFNEVKFDNSQTLKY